MAVLEAALGIYLVGAVVLFLGGVTFGRSDPVATAVGRQYYKGLTLMAVGWPVVLASILIPSS